jgi:DNA-binding MarR family transcriptional regulator
MSERRSPPDVRRALHRYGLARDRLNLGLGRVVGISRGDLHVLEQLEASGGLTPKELGRRLALTSGAVTFLVDRLERAGWVARTSNPRDRRSTIVTLSPTAQARGHAELDAYHRDVQDVIERLPARERATVAGFLDAIADAAERHGDRYADAGARD